MYRKIGTVKLRTYLGHSITMLMTKTRQGLADLAKAQTPLHFYNHKTLTFISLYIRKKQINCRFTFGSNLISNR